MALRTSGASVSALAREYDVSRQTIMRARDMHAKGKGPAAIARELDVARSSVYRMLEDSADA